LDEPRRHREHALAYAAKAVDKELAKGGCPTVHHHDLGHRCRGRVLRASGRSAEAARAFNAAAEESRGRGYRYLEVLALREYVGCEGGLQRRQEAHARLNELAAQLGMSASPLEEATEPVRGATDGNTLDALAPEAVERPPGAKLAVSEMERQHAELTPMKMSALRKQAVAAGIDSEALEAVDDSDDPRGSIIALLLEAHIAPAQSSSAESEANAEMERRRVELIPMKMSHLKKRALAAGVAKELIVNVDDEDDPKGAIIAMVLEAEMPARALDSTEELEVLRAELAPMKMSHLKKRALVVGVDEEVLDDVDDADDPKEAILTLLLDLHRKDLEAAADNGGEAELEALRAELAPMKVSHLKKRALAAGVDEEVLDDVDDAEDPKDALISVLVEEHRKTLESQDDGAAAQAELEALRAGLTPLKMSALRKRALAESVDSEALEAAEDSDDPRAVIVALLLDTKRAVRGSVRPHFGAAIQQTPSKMLKRHGNAAEPHRVIPHGKHVMLSYQVRALVLLCSAFGVARRSPLVHNNVYDCAAVGLARAGHGGAHKADGTGHRLLDGHRRRDEHQHLRLDGGGRAERVLRGVLHGGGVPDVRELVRPPLQATHPQT
jgi:hypothetical protein